LADIVASVMLELCYGVWSFMQSRNFLDAIAE